MSLIDYSINMRFIQFGRDIPENQKEEYMNIKPVTAETRASTSKSENALSVASTETSLELPPPVSVSSHLTEQMEAPTTRPSDTAPKTDPVTEVIAKINELFGIREFGFIYPLANPKRYERDELGMGYLFADTFHNLLRYVRDADEWYHYIDGVWREDKGGIIVRQCAKVLIEYLKATLSDEKFLDEFSKRNKRETVIKEAKDVYSKSLSDFDIDPFLLNCLNGTIDLRSLQFRPHDPADFLTKKAKVIYNPNAKCERWDKFVGEITCGNADLLLYLQKSCGYGLSGDTSEECLFILYGPTTRNGKGTFMESTQGVLGDYAKTIQPDSLAYRKSNGSGHSDDIARLAGIRFVNASELPNDMKLNAAIVKQITGGDTVTTRFIYKGFFEYRPQFKIYINTNHLPEVGDDTLFSSGRLKLIPFDRHFDETEQDKSLKSFFREADSKSAILNWLLKGYELYKSEELTPPSKVVELLHEYRKNSDAVGLYIENRLVSCDERERTKTSDFHLDFLKWCLNEDVAELSLKEFVQAIRQKKLLARDREIGHYIKGYRIRNE